MITISKDELIRKMTRYGFASPEMTVEEFVEYHVPAEKIREKSCAGCRHEGMWEEELDAGYRCPCTGCIRRLKDNYER